MAYESVDLLDPVMGWWRDGGTVDAEAEKRGRVFLMSSRVRTGLSTVRVNPRQDRGQSRCIGVRKSGSFFCVTIQVLNGSPVWVSRAGQTCSDWLRPVPLPLLGETEHFILWQCSCSAFDVAIMAIRVHTRHNATLGHHGTHTHTRTAQLRSCSCPAPAPIPSSCAFSRPDDPYRLQ